MEPYQERYLSNIREIAVLSDFRGNPSDSFDAWYNARLAADRKAAALRRENLHLLQDCLFPSLDQVFSLSPEALSVLEEFADQLMDWKTNLDPGLYVVIHKALLSLQRIRRDRDGVIRELYRLGMGYYYLYMNISGMDFEQVRALNFRNEMLFTEAASYFRFFREIDREETKGYILRSMANIALCTKDKKKKIATGIRILQILQDPYYRELAPGLPWDVFLSRTHQQMCANRNELSTGDLTQDELAAVLDSCYVVFRNQQGQERPNVRWLWPLYEMEYSCGYADADLTMNRLEKLINETPAGTYDNSGLYGGVQLPLYYSHMLRDHPRMADDPLHLRFMVFASGRLRDTLTGCPSDFSDSYFSYLIRETVTEYIEYPGCVPYLDLTRSLVRRFAAPLYIRGCKAGRILRLLCENLLTRFPDFFDDLPVLRGIAPEKKKDTLLEYAENCGFYYDFGLLKISITRPMQTRELFVDEQEIYQLHCLAGWEDLKARPSTALYADIALGHHAFYNGMGGYPDFYRRTKSPYRQMTDVVALAAWLLENDETPFRTLVTRACEEEGTRFSPRVISVFSEPAVQQEIGTILREDTISLYAAVWQDMKKSQSDADGK